MAGKTLRDLVDNRMSIEGMIADQDGELTPELEALIRDNDCSIEQKAARVAGYVRALEGDVDVIKIEMARLERRKKARERAVDYLKNSVLAEALLRLGRARIDTPTVTIAMQLNNPRLDGIPEDDAGLAEFAMRAYHHDGNPFAHRVEQYKIDKVGLLAAAKTDATLLPDGVSIVRDESVRIR